MLKKHPLIKKNDKVIVLTGKEKGKIGTVLKVDVAKNRAVVEKINIMKRHTKPRGKNVQGGIIEKEASVHISNIMIICDKCAKPSRIGKNVFEDGSTARICKKCNVKLD